MANCTECKQQRAGKPATISIFEHENSMVRLERCNKRLWIALIVSMAIICALSIVKIPNETQNEVITHETIEERIQT